VLGFWVLIFALFAARLGLSSGAHGSRVAAVLVAAGTLAFGVLVLVIGVGWNRRAMDLTTVSPEAFRAVRDGLAAAGLPVPDQIVLASHGATSAKFLAWPRRRVRLYLALPPLLALPVADLVTLAASAVAVGQVTAYPRPAQRLWHKRVALEVRLRNLQRRGKQSGRPARRIEAFLAATDTFARDVRSRSDQAAANVAGSSEAAARALYGERTVNLDFFVYAERFRRLITRKKRVPAGLYAGWFSEWTAAPEWLQGFTLFPVKLFADEHTGLGAFDAAEFPARIRALRTGQAGPPAVSMVSPRLAKRLASAAAKQFAPAANGIRAVEGEKIDLKFIYIHDVEDASLLAAASAVLGRAADRLDTVELLRSGRGVELATPLSPDEVEADKVDGGISRGALFALLLISALKESGMRQLDPYRQWLMSGQSGEVIDVAHVVTEALASPDGTDRLCSLLR